MSHPVPTQTYGICTYCEEERNRAVELEPDTIVTDFNDPGASDGHGQTEQDVLVCPQCERTYALDGSIL